MNDNKTWENLEPTFSLVEDRLRILKQTLPEAFTDGKINFDTLKELLGEAIADEEQDEHFGLSWTGKREARKLAGMPSKGTLVPVKGKGLHEDTTENIFIEGDNLEVLKLLHKSYYGKIKMIYIDPPYNTGNDFIYKDDYKMPLESYLQRSGQMNEMDEMLTSNPKSSGRFHSDWLNMLYPRLRVAKDLLRDDGVIFISIGNDEVHNLREMMNEIFGEENFVECLTWNKRVPKNDKGIGNIHEFVLLYVKDRAFPHAFKIGKDGLEDVFAFVDKLKRKKTPIPEAEIELKKFYNMKGYDRGITLYNSLDENYEIWGKINLSWPNSTTYGPDYIVPHPKTNNRTKMPERGWRWKKETFNTNADFDEEAQQYRRVKELHDGSFVCNRIWFDTNERTQPSSIQYLKDVDDFLLRSIISTKSDGSIEVDSLLGKSIFPYAKPVSLIETLISSCVGVNDIVLDFFAGSGTTAQSVSELNLKETSKRKFICVQLPEPLEESKKEHKVAYKAGFRTISEITVKRIVQVSKKIEEELNKGLPLEQKPDLGFKFYRLERSNFKAWSDYQGTNLDELRGLLQEQVSTSFVPDATKEAILTEILLLEGFPLDSSISQDESFERNAVWRVSSEFSEHRLFVTLDDEIWEETISTAEELEANDIFICLDKSLSDESKIRMSDVCRLKVI